MGLGYDVERAIESIVAHGRFRAARNAYFEGYLTLYSGDPPLNKLLADARGTSLLLSSSARPPRAETTILRSG